MRCILFLYQSNWERHFKFYSCQKRANRLSRHQKIHLVPFTPLKHGKTWQAIGILARIWSFTFWTFGIHIKKREMNVKMCICDGLLCKFSDKVGCPELPTACPKREPDTPVGVQKTKPDTSLGVYRSQPDTPLGVQKDYQTPLWVTEEGSPCGWNQRPVTPHPWHLIRRFWMTTKPLLCYITTQAA